MKAVKNLKKADFDTVSKRKVIDYTNEIRI